MNDARLAALAARPTSIDAMGWAERARSGQSITLGEWSEARSLAFLTRLMQCRPPRVVALEPDEDPQLGIGANTLVVELPQDPADRASLFSLEAEVAAAGGFEGEPDVDQRYLMLHW